MIVRFWGVRGSVPSPGKETSYFGGNTTCITVETEKTFIIVDGGTGIRHVGSYINEKKIKDIHIIFTHYHWDHLQGLPFFTPLFNPKIHIDIYGKKNVSQIMRHQMKQPFFPADYNKLPSEIIHKKLPQKLDIGDICINTIEQNHPSGCVGLKFTSNSKSFVFMTDNEIFPPYAPITTREDFIDFIRGAKFFVHDSQYTDDDMKKKRGWGHSTFNEVITLARDAGIKNTIFTHHEPLRKDEHLREMVRELKNKNKDLNLRAAREGMALKLLSKKH